MLFLHHPGRMQCSSWTSPASTAFLGRMIGDLGAVATGALVVLGDRLGLYKAMQAGDRMTAAELAMRTGTHERYVRQWLSAQAAAGYVEYDNSARRRDPPISTPSSHRRPPTKTAWPSMAGGSQALSALWIDEQKVV